MPHLTIGSFRLHYEVHENCLPFDTLFIHGNFASNSWWLPSLNSMTKMRGGGNGRAILAEWRGCGQSSAASSAEELSPIVLAQDYLQLLEHLGVESCHIVGHSAGGLISLCALMQAQKRFVRSVLLDPVSPWGLDFSKDRYDILPLMQKNKEVCAKVLLATIYEQDLDLELRERIVNEAFSVDELNWQAIIPAFQNTNISHELPKINTPCLILHGTEDNTLPLFPSEWTAQCLPNGEFEAIPRQGHSWNLEKPDQFAKRCADYLYL